MAERADLSQIPTDELVRMLQSSSAESAEPRSLLERAGRVAGLGARGAIRGVAALPTLMAEAVAYPLRAATGGRYFPSPSAVLERSLSQAGLPEPETGAERVATDVAGTLGGVGAGLQVARTIAGAAGAVPSIGQRIAQQFTRAPTGQLIAGGTGGTTAAVAREEGAGPTGQMVAGISGAMIPSALAGTANVAQGLVAPLTQQGQRRIAGGLLRSVSGPHPELTAQRMAGAKAILPGSEPTAAEVAQSGGISSLQRVAASKAPEAFSQRDIEQKLARIEALSRIAKTPQQRQAFEMQRGDVAREAYEGAYEKGIDIRRDPQTGQFLTKPEIAGVKGEITQLLRRPAIRQAVKNARILAANEGERLTDPAGSIKGLDYVKRALDDQIANTIGNEQRILKNLKDRLLTTIDRLSPSYKLARETYAEMSGPLSRAEIGQELLNKLQPALTEGNIPVRLTANKFAQAMREADETARHATGFQGATMAGTMKPEELAVLEAIKADLARGTQRELGGPIGSSTFQNLAQEQLMQTAGVQNLPQLLSRPVQLTNYLLRALYGPANEQIAERIALGLLNPAGREGAGQLMREALKPTRTGMLAAGTAARPFISQPWLYARPSE